MTQTQQWSVATTSAAHQVRDARTNERICTINTSVTDQLRKAHLISALPELLAYIRPFVAMTFQEGAAAEKAGKSLIFCQQDKLNPCWNGRKTDIIGKHWDGESPACDACNLRAAIAKARGEG